MKEHLLVFLLSVACLADEGKPQRRGLEFQPCFEIPDATCKPKCEDGKEMNIVNGFCGNFFNSCCVEIPSSSRTTTTRRPPTVNPPSKWYRCSNIGGQCNLACDADKQFEVANGFCGGVLGYRCCLTNLSASPKSEPSTPQPAPNHLPHYCLETGGHCASKCRHSEIEVKNTICPAAVRYPQKCCLKFNKTPPRKETKKPQTSEKPQTTEKPPITADEDEHTPDQPSQALCLQFGATCKWECSKNELQIANGKCSGSAFARKCCLSTSSNEFKLPPHPPHPPQPPHPHPHPVHQYHPHSPRLQQTQCKAKSEIFAPRHPPHECDEVGGQCKSDCSDEEIEVANTRCPVPSKCCMGLKKPF